MNKAIIINKTGNSDVLEYKNIAIPEPEAHEVLINQTAIGINFFEISQRKGILKLPQLPITPGFEACGIIEKVGKNVEGFQEGDRVAYATASHGSYTQYRVIDSKYLISVPYEIEDHQVVASLFKGMMAHLLMRRTFFVRPNNFILIHSAAGGVGSLMCQMAKYYGAKVIATVGSDEKIATAEELGCDYVLNYNNEDFNKEITKITRNRGVSVVYDSVGKKTFEKSFHAVCPLGLLVSFGESSGAVPAINLEKMFTKSIFITRPSIFTYKSHRMELILSANEIFDMLKQNILNPIIYKEYSLDQAAEAHLAIESGKTIGSSIFVL